VKYEDIVADILVPVDAPQKGDLTFFVSSRHHGAVSGLFVFQFLRLFFSSELNRTVISQHVQVL
jgi:hypothetical protein